MEIIDPRFKGLDVAGTTLQLGVLLRDLFLCTESSSCSGPNKGPGPDTCKNTLMLANPGSPVSDFQLEKMNETFDDQCKISIAISGKPMRPMTPAAMRCSFGRRLVLT
jgi:hypothetical protein